METEFDKTLSTLEREKSLTSFEMIRTSSLEVLGNDHFHFLSEGDYLTLRNSMLEMINNGQLENLANSLQMIRRDLASATRDTRQLAYSSYHVLVRTLAERDQAKPLSSLLNSMTSEFETSDDSDLILIHFESLMVIMEYFKEKLLMAPIVFGLNIISGLLRRNASALVSAISLAIDPFLDDVLFGQMLSIPEHDPLRKQVDMLFKYRGLGFFKNLLSTLFRMEDRHVRKVILDYLINMGPIIHPDLIEALGQSCANPTPWYVKRNLLHILSVRPPLELANLLETLLLEDHPRVLELVYRSVFLIHDREAFKLGKKLLLESEGEELDKILSYLSYSQERAYIPILIYLFENTENDKLKNEILIGLGRLKNAHSAEFLMTLIKKGAGLFSGAKNPYRVAAAKALAHNKTQAVQSFFNKFVKDKDIEVRDIAQRFRLSQSQSQ